MRDRELGIILVQRPIYNTSHSIIEIVRIISINYSQHYGYQTNSIGHPLEFGRGRKEDREKRK